MSTVELVITIEFTIILVIIIRI